MTSSRKELLQYAQHYWQSEKQVGVLLYDEEHANGNENCRNDVEPAYICFFFHSLFGFSDETFAVLDDEDNDDGEQESSQSA